MYIKRPKNGLVIERVKVINVMVKKREVKFLVSILIKSIFFQKRYYLFIIEGILRILYF